MRTQYLLPCSCGQKITLDARQAGGKVRCAACGVEQSAPSMRGLRDLETIEVEEPKSTAHPAPSSPWGLRQGLLLVGALLFFGGLLPAGILASRLPEKVVFQQGEVIDHNHEQIDQMPISQTWMVWKEDVLGHGLVEYPMASKLQYEQQRALLLRWIVFALCFTALGLLVSIAGLAAPKPNE